MRYVFTVLFSLILAVGLAGCDSGDGGPGPTAQVRFMHASPDAGNVNVAVEGNEVLTDISFSGTMTSPTVSDYQDVPVKSEAKVEVKSAQSGDVLLSTTAEDANLEEDKKYTIIVAGSASPSDSPKAIVLRDDFRDDLDNNQIGLRLVHGAALVGPVDIYLNAPGTPLSDQQTTQTLTTNFQFTDDFPGGFAGQFAPQDVSSDGSVLVVTPAGTPSVRALELPVGTGGQGSLDVQAGQHITGVAIDAPGSQPPAGALIQVDNPNSQ